ncbi:MAG: SDR family oxidoreductase [Candidatus Bipolaricaulota bacterium]|nr:SDR family oxidoreductase [Candidatus Bipolaricaulota bacterium]
MTAPRRSTEQPAKLAVVTGGTRNIGLAIAEALGGLGYRLVLVYRTDEEQAKIAVGRLETLGATVRAARADVTDEEDVRRLFDGVRNAEGRLDLLVNNVGDFLFKPLLETTLIEWEDVLRSNLTSAFLCTKASLPLLRNRGGQIISIASMHADALRAVPNTLPYAVAKTGIVLLTKSLAKSEATYGVRANAVCPGFVRSSVSPHVDPSTIPCGRLADPAEIAHVVRFLASDEASYVTGAVINVHGGALL